MSVIAGVVVDRRVLDPEPVRKSGHEAGSGKRGQIGVGQRDRQPAPRPERGGGQSRHAPERGDVGRATGQVGRVLRRERQQRFDAGSPDGGQRPRTSVVAGVRLIPIHRVPIGR